MTVAGLPAATALAAVVVAAALSAAGGAVGGIWVGGKDIGYHLAGTIGAFYGPIAGLFGIIIGIVALAIIYH